MSVTWNNLIVTGNVVTLNGYDHWDFSRVGWNKPHTGDLTQHFRYQTLKLPAEIWSSSRKGKRGAICLYFSKTYDVHDYICGSNKRWRPPSIGMDDLEIALQIDELAKMYDAYDRQQVYVAGGFHCNY